MDVAQIHAQQVDAHLRKDGSSLEYCFYVDVYVDSLIQRAPNRHFLRYSGFDQHTTLDAVQARRNREDNANTPRRDAETLLYNPFRTRQPADLGWLMVFESRRISDKSGIHKHLGPGSTSWIQ